MVKAAVQEAPAVTQTHELALGTAAEPVAPAGRATHQMPSGAGQEEQAAPTARVLHHLRLQACRANAVAVG